MKQMDTSGLTILPVNTEVIKNKDGTYTYYQHQTPREFRRAERRKNREFSKWIVTLYAAACICWITADYVLAFMYQMPINSEVTIELTRTVVIAILAYFTKSYGEKHSRNKHGLDENGQKIKDAITEDILGSYGDNKGVEG